MDVRDILRAHKKTIISKWVEQVFATYPLETTGFLRSSSDPFANPVAHMTREAASALFDAMIGEETDPEVVKSSLDRFVKLRAVQKFTPGKSMAVFYLMKPILKEEVFEEMRSKGQLYAYLEIEERLDTLVLMAFDIYMNARETLAESRIKEIRNQYAQLAKWARQIENDFENNLHTDHEKQSS